MFEVEFNNGWLRIKRETSAVGVYLTDEQAKMVASAISKASQQSAQADEIPAWLCECGYKHLKPYEGVRCDCGAVFHPEMYTKDGRYVAPCGCHGDVMCNRHAEWFSVPH